MEENEYNSFEEDEILPITPKKKKEKKAGILILIKTQLIICIIALLAAFIIKFIGGDIYRLTRDKYISMFNDYTSAEEVMQTVTGVFDFSSGTDNTSSASGGIDSQQSQSSAAQDPAANESSTSSPPDNSGESSQDTSSEEEESGQYTMDVNEYKSMMNAKSAAINSMQMPLSGRISDEYGYRIHPISGKLAMHYGVDIAAPYGSDIGAAMSGTVSKTGESSSYGIYIMLSHGDGLETMYAHCSETLLKEGDTVEKGQAIAKVGSTGVSTGAHCHFEVRINGTRINPMWLVGEQSI
ncbi:MAG TPA: M23 family metallopeptidase [Firmicutes bacterium]|nr:M23 family metallopeptidase [Bacillota bacterium]